MVNLLAPGMMEPLRLDVQFLDGHPALIGDTDAKFAGLRWRGHLTIRRYQNRNLPTQVVEQQLRSMLQIPIESRLVVVGNDRDTRIAQG